MSHKIGSTADKLDSIATRMDSLAEDLCLLAKDTDEGVLSSAISMIENIDCDLDDAEDHFTCLKDLIKRASADHPGR